MEKRIREFCELASLYISETDEFLICDDQYHGPKLTKPFEEYGIQTYEDWDTLMDIEIKWLQNNKKEVLKNLSNLENEWPESCEAIKYLLKS